MAVVGVHTPLGVFLHEPQWALIGEVGERLQSVVSGQTYHTK